MNSQESYRKIMEDDPTPLDSGCKNVPNTRDPTPIDTVPVTQNPTPIDSCQKKIPNIQETFQ